MLVRGGLGCSLRPDVPSHFPVPPVLTTLVEVAPFRPAPLHAKISAPGAKVPRSDPRREPEGGQKSPNCVPGNLANIWYLLYRTHIGTLRARSGRTLFLDCILDTHVFMFLATFREFCLKMGSGMDPDGGARSSGMTLRTPGSVPHPPKMRPCRPGGRPGWPRPSRGYPPERKNTKIHKNQPLPLPGARRKFAVATPLQRPYFGQSPGITPGKIGGSCLPAGRPDNACQKIGGSCALAGRNRKTTAENSR